MRVIEKSVTESDILLRYSMLCNDKEYGIAIEMLAPDGTISCKEVINDLSKSKEDTDKIFEIVAQNTVTPTCFKEILDDLIGV